MHFVIDACFPDIDCHSCNEHTYNSIVMQNSNGRSRERQSTFPMISVDEAIAIMLQQTEPLPAVTVPLQQLQLGSILAQDAVAPDPLPPFPASIMDGYAVISADTQSAAAFAEDCVLQVIARITAGVDADTVQLQPGQCAYITTGAKLPKGADAVIKVNYKMLVNLLVLAITALAVSCVMISL
jgi:molybdopterin biosynthesis enzyme